MFNEPYNDSLTSLIIWFNLNFVNKEVNYMINKRRNLKKKKQKDNYNFNLYEFTKKSTKLLRKTYSINPFKKLKELGLFGFIAEKVGNQFSKPIITKSAFSAAGSSGCNIKKYPYIGSILYTIYYYFFSFIAFGVVTMLINLFFN